MTHCRLFKAVQDTLPDSEKVKRVDSKEELGEAVKMLLKYDHAEKLKHSPKGKK